MLHRRYSATFRKQVDLVIEPDGSKNEFPRGGWLRKDAKGRNPVLQSQPMSPPLPPVGDPSSGVHSGMLQMTKNIHGHEVLHMILNSAEPFTRQSLQSAIIERFGENARFFTCSAEGMTASKLITFLDARGKFLPLGDGFTTASEKICGH
uniref:Probable metal-binding protein n=1 Tax=Candidatus Kentrum sp. TUN TaxID=2126343 RepID=A0A450ZLS1_9GAMM|nr:MAG: probable metal-binding protein [Candidatus Kentron sp. TUN]VFK58414.1 MAG: probable metal-binding protein [Candidatus Kentron sp. TUN]